MERLEMDISDLTPPNQSQKQSDRPYTAENKLKIYDMFRDYVKHEDTLVNVRLTWVLAIQGFLFAAYGVTFSKKLDILQKIADLGYFRVTKDLTHAITEIQAILAVIAFVGALISFFGWISINAAHEAVRNIENIFRQNIILQSDKSNGQKIVNVSGLYLPNIVAGGLDPEVSSKRGGFVAQSIPWILIICWILALIHAIG
jgi:hypothetical protein